MLRNDPGTVVRLPHDGMIGTPVSPAAPARSDMGYFTGGISNYTRSLMIPREWEKDCVGLQFDGAMMNAAVEVNGCKAGAQHYGYAPFYVDLTDLVSCGEENRITIHVNTSMQPNSRWYTGSGLYRGACLLHGPRVHIEPDGIFARTREVAEGYAFLETGPQPGNGKNRPERTGTAAVGRGSSEPVPGQGTGDGSGRIPDPSGEGRGEDHG